MTATATCASRLTGSERRAIGARAIGNAPRRDDPGDIRTFGAAVVRKCRPHPLEIAAPGDLAVSVPLPVLPTVPEGWSVYAMDRARRAWTAVNVPDTALIGTVPFAHAAQYERATRAARVPWGAPRLRLPRTLPVFSIGRCGSTLLTRLLTAAGTNVASEYDAFTAIGTLCGDRPADAALRADMARLAAEAAGYLTRGLDPESTLALKFRSQASDGAAAIAAGLDADRAVFLTRDPDDWAVSMHRHFPNVGAAALAMQLRRHVIGVAQAQRFGCRIAVIGYDALTRDPAGAIRAAGGPVVAAADLRAVMEHDAQAGTPVARTARRAAPDAIWMGKFRSAWTSLAPAGDLRALGLDTGLARVR